MRPTQAVKCINEAISNKHSYMLWGASGIGKSQIVQQIAKSKGIGMIDMRLSTYDPTDLKGLLYFKDDKAVWLSLGELPDIMRDGEEGILFLDEINAAPPATAAAAVRPRPRGRQPPRPTAHSSHPASDAAVAAPGPRRRR